MANPKHTITDSEYTIMDILWQAEGKMTVSDVLRALEDQNWSPSTVATFLQRLLKKGVIGCQRQGKTNLYYPLLEQKEHSLRETETFLSKLYKGSVKNMVAALYENQRLSPQDLTELREFFDLEKPHGPGL